MPCQAPGEKKRASNELVPKNWLYGHAGTASRNVTGVTLTDPDALQSRSTTDDALTIYAQLLRGEIEGTEALRASQQMLRMITDTIPQAIWWKDRNCTFLGVNRFLADLAGLEPDDMIGKTDFDMPWAQGENFDAKWYQDWDREVMESGEPQYGIREELRMKDGSTVWIETSKVPLRSLDDEVIGVLGTFQDVTERHQAEQQRERDMELLDERVQARTQALRKANETLRREVEERVRLQAKERKQRAYAEALRDTAAAMARSLDLDEVLDQILAGVDRLISHHLSAVILIEEGGVHRVAHIQESRQDRASPDCGVGKEVTELPLVAALRRSSGTVVRNDISGPSLGAESRSAIGAQIKMSDMRIGYLIVEAASPGFFTEGHIERLAAVADLAAGAISNAQLFSAEAELAALEERQRLARELHDAVSQTLWTANLVSDSLTTTDDPEATRDQLERLKTLTRGALAEMRSLLLELRPAAMAETQLGELLDQLVDALVSRKSISAKVVTSESVSEPSPQVKHAIYRIAQESLNNVRRHSQASEVEVRLDVDDDRIVLQVKDDGVGFAIEDCPADRLGLVIMGERAESIGARLTIDSEPGRGTTIDVSAPLEQVQ